MKTITTAYIQGVGAVVMLSLLWMVPVSASVVDESGCVMSATYTAADTIEVQLVDCQFGASVVAVAAGDVITLNASEQSALAARGEVGETFAIPVSLFTGSLGSDGTSYGGGDQFEYERAVVVPAPEPEVVSEELVPTEVMEVAVEPPVEPAAETVSDSSEVVSPKTDNTVINDAGSLQQTLLELLKKLLSLLQLQARQ